MLQRFTSDQFFFKMLLLEPDRHDAPPIDLVFAVFLLFRNARPLGGFAFLFWGPDPANPDRPETLARIRFEGANPDGEGNERPVNYVTTPLGITVGHTLGDLKTAYGTTVSAGSNANEHWYRYTEAGGELCFYFGSGTPTDASEIVEIATECRR